MSETLKEVVEQEDESQIVAQEAHDDYYDSRSMIPADNVDATGVPWATVGENIRFGANAIIDLNKVNDIFSLIIGYDVEIQHVVCTLHGSNKSITVDNSLFKGGTSGVYLSSGVISGFMLTGSSLTNSNREPVNLVPDATQVSYIKLKEPSTITTGTISLAVIIIK